MNVAFTPPAPGERIMNAAGLRYDVGALLGEGGFGMVFEAADEWGNPLVLKVLKPTATFEQVRGNWEREITKLGIMRHPNIVYLHDWFVHRGSVFCMVLERCESPLEKLPLDQRYAMMGPLARDVLEGLFFIHRNSYVHKDMHAGNVLLHRQRCPLTGQTAVSFRISDLGISNLEGVIGQGTTVMAQWMMPPERFNPGEFGPVSKQTDLYHFALLLLEIMARRPLKFSHEEILAGGPRTLAQNMRHPVADVLARALRRHVAQRPASALDMWRELFHAGLRAG